MYCAALIPINRDRLDSCLSAAECTTCRRCAKHCVCAAVAKATADLRAWAKVSLPATISHILAGKAAVAGDLLVADIAFLWDAGVKVSENEFRVVTDRENNPAVILRTRKAS